MRRLFLIAALLLHILTVASHAAPEKAPDAFTFAVEVASDNSWAVKWSYSIFGEQHSDVEQAQYLADGKLASETTWHYRADQSKTRAVLSFDGSARPLKYEFFDDKDKLIRSRPIINISKHKRAFKEETGVGEMNLRYDATGRLVEISFLCLIDNTRITYNFDVQGRVLSKTQNRPPHLQKTQYFSSRPGLRKADQIFKLENDEKPSSVFDYKYNKRGNIIEFKGTGKPSGEDEVHNPKMVFSYDAAGRYSEVTAFDDGKLMGRQKLTRNAKGESNGMIAQFYDKGVLKGRVVMRDFEQSSEIVQYGEKGQIDQRMVYSKKPFQLTLEEQYVEGRKLFADEYNDGKLAFKTSYKPDGTIDWRKPVNPDGSITFSAEDNPDTKKTN